MLVTEQLGQALGCPDNVNPAAPGAPGPVVSEPVSLQKRGWGGSDPPKAVLG